MRYKRHAFSNTCQSCGQGYDGNNHHCSDQHEGGVKAAQTKANNEELSLSYEPLLPTYNRRIYRGFMMMGLCERSS